MSVNSVTSVAYGKLEELDGEALALGDSDALPDCVGLTLLDSDAEGDSDGLPVGDTDPLGEALPDGLLLAEPELLGDSDGD